MKLDYIRIDSDGSILISDVEVVELPKTYKVCKVKEGEYIYRALIKKDELDTLNDGFMFTLDIEKAKDLLMDNMRKQLVAEEQRHKKRVNRITTTLTQLL